MRKMRAIGQLALRSTDPRRCADFYAAAFGFRAVAVDDGGADLELNGFELSLRRGETATRDGIQIGFKVDTNISGLGDGSALDPAAVILAGVREVFELDRLRALVPATLRPMPSPSSPFPLSDLPLTDHEALVLLRATGARSVEAIIREMQATVGERETLAVLYSLLVLGVLVDVRALP